MTSNQTTNNQETNNQETSNKKQIAIASDHAGFEQKEALKPYLINLGLHVKDFGPRDDSRVDYPDFAADVARDVSRAQSDLGILFCGTGIGMAITANKIKGIRAANIIDPKFAALAREHNNINILTLSGRFIDLDTNKEIIKAFLSTEYTGGRHQGRLDKIHLLES
jgi:ribose 5-phosphate isomerase B